MLKHVWKCSKSCRFNCDRITSYNVCYTKLLRLDFQEFMIMPVGADSFSDAVRICAETYQSLKKVVAEKYGKDAVNIGDEGGFAPPVKTIDEALAVLLEGVKKAGYEDEIVFTLDCAASEFYDEKTNSYLVSGESMSSDKLISLYKEMVSQFV